MITVQNSKKVPEGVGKTSTKKSTMELRASRGTAAKSYKSDKQPKVELFSSNFVFE